MGRASHAGGRILVAVLSTDDVAPRGRVALRELDADGRALSVVLFRRREGVVAAYLNRCPHLGVPLGRAETGLLDRGRRHLLCGTHGARFQAEDGLCVHGPCAGDQLDALEVVEVFGQLQIFASASLLAEIDARRRALTAPGRSTPALAAQAPAGPDGSRSD